MSENTNPNIPATPKSRTKTIIDDGGKIRAVPIDPIQYDNYSSPPPEDAFHPKRKVSTTNRSDTDVKRSRMVQQYGSPPPSPQAVGIMPGGDPITPQAGI